MLLQWSTCIYTVHVSSEITSASINVIKVTHFVYSHQGTSITLPLYVGRKEWIQKLLLHQCNQDHRQSAIFINQLHFIAEVCINLDLTVLAPKKARFVYWMNSYAVWQHVTKFVRCCHHFELEGYSSYHMIEIGPQLWLALGLFWLLQQLSCFAISETHS